MNLFYQLQQAFTVNIERNAFFISGKFYTYYQLSACISSIRSLIQSSITNDEKIIGIIANDDLQTYASIIAVWLEGKAYVPISTEFPIERNTSIINQAGILTIIDSSPNSFLELVHVINTTKLKSCITDLSPKLIDDDQLAYMLFTSGTTGAPKGVPITRNNLFGIIEALVDLKLDINDSDRCLQMSELTFDVSVTSFLFPLLYGACVYTIPKGKIKYSYIAQLMDDENLTITPLVPSVLNFLRPYFDELRLPGMKYCFLTAEALPVDLAISWSECVPNAKIYNLYGPTENTVWSTFYLFDPHKVNKSYNGMVSIGKTLNNTIGIIIDQDQKHLNVNSKGELCLAGKQLTPGYWKDKQKNKESFFYSSFNNEVTRFYKTGDLCSIDEEGDIIYMGRMDYQTKIQGFRVELSEIEYHTKVYLKKRMQLHLRSIINQETMNWL